jgi:predicted secreted hydrolase
MISRRQGIAALAAWPLADQAEAQLPTPTPGSVAATPVEDPVRRGRPMRFPRDHGAHLGSRIEWWYATGWLRAESPQELFGFQVTFFRSRTGLAERLPGRLAPRQLLFAHAALTDTRARRHVHADRISRWSGDDSPDLRARASLQDADVALAGWSFRRSDADGRSRYATDVSAAGLSLQLALHCTQAVLLQGDRGFSRKGPEESQASHYTSETQVEAAGTVALDGRNHAVRGRAWIDHEWSDELLHPQAVGWDWIGVNLEDGRALTAFQLRRADGSTLWAGGSLRSPEGDRPFAADEVRFTPLRRWRSPQSNAEYPLEWSVQTSQGTWRVRALMEAQELDSRSSTGTIYWEGLSELLDEGQRRVGLGYLEMTGYAGRLSL